MTADRLHTPATRWRLVGPWYRWAVPGLPAEGLRSAPAIQMFAGDDFMTGFLARPQRSLKSDPVVDVVQLHDLVPAGSFASRVASLLPLRADGSPAQRGVTPATESLFRARLAPGAMRKLYQPTHDRHYLVSCELHCDEPGFPRVPRERVCEAGFVLRRRRSVVPAAVSAATVEAEHSKLRRAEADLYELLQLDEAGRALDMLGADDASLRANALARQAVLVAQARVLNAGIVNWPALLAQRRLGVTAARGALADWLAAQGVRVAVEGWFPALVAGRPSPTQGAWRELDEAAQVAEPLLPGAVPGAMPGAVPGSPSGAAPGPAPDIDLPTEHVLPLRPLVPDPRETTHDAAGRTLYHGLVPTHSLQFDAAGQPRFDPHASYELRCFVRAHHHCPPKAGKSPDCDGPVVWSAPSEPFRLAAAMDVLGSANRPIAIRMPDLRDLAAQAALRPRGRLSPVRFVQPQHLSPRGEGGTMGGEAICSFSIPLITIVALFVLNLFLPIVVFIFQLWFLLVFRFCIPPQIQASAAVDVALAAAPPGLELEADVAIDIEGAAPFVRTVAALRNELHAAMKASIRADTGKTDEDADFTGQDNNALGLINQSLRDNATLKPPAGAPAGTTVAPPALGTPLVFEPAVTPQWAPQRAPPGASPSPTGIGAGA